MHSNSTDYLEELPNPANTNPTLITAPLIFRSQRRRSRKLVFDSWVDSEKYVDMQAIKCNYSQSGNAAAEYNTESLEKSKDKGKGRPIITDLETGEDRSRKRKKKFPIILVLSFQPLKLVIKSHKRIKLAQIVKWREFMESEEEDEDLIKVLCLMILSSLQLLWVPKKTFFGSAMVYAHIHWHQTIASRCLKVIEPTMFNAPVEVSLVINTDVILIPSPVNTLKT
ncbi:hypothetical protein P692DRAFT_201805791 [Suillus brevipes Sb2]|nr:hypothetical protein P692DRAFT_201805791 [Suillus brevipes Sb2]